MMKHNRRRGYTHSKLHNDEEQMTMANVTCFNYTQPLDHFNPGSNNYTFEQRYCIYDGYDGYDDHDHDRTDDMYKNKNPIFFYTGNESPIDEYVNNTGLLWELAPKFNALVIFAEHRFEGTSVPSSMTYMEESNVLESNNNNNQAGGHDDGCFTYLTTSQALADYASLISHVDPSHVRPVITFGGSYGGMLSAWMRIVYGSVVAGSIASSAPIWGLPKTLLGLSSHNNNNNEDEYDRKVMDGASHVVGQALLKEVHNNTHNNDDTITAATNNHCFNNLLATWPLIHYFGQSVQGRSFLSDIFHLCQPLQKVEDASALLEWAQSPWFDLAEGDYPYPSSYIPYALGEGLHDLPAWPLQEACHGSSGLNNDFGISMGGNFQDVNFNIQYGQNEETSLILGVDWNTIEAKQVNVTENLEDVASTLFSAVREAVSIWFNVTKSLDCFDVIPAINDNDNEDGKESTKKMGNLQGISLSKRNIMGKQTSNVNVCQQKLDNETVWSSLVCNDNINLIMTYARGVGRDFYWPPSHPKDQRRYQDTIIDRTDVEALYEEMCADPEGIFGYPDKTKADPYSTFLDDYYGGRRIGQVTNILFANGLLDPWSAAGVVFPTDGYHENGEETCTVKDNRGESFEYKCSMVQNITKDGGLKAILLELGGHHLDLMYSSDMDPNEVKAARMIQENHITKWIEDWHKTLL